VAPGRQYPLAVIITGVDRFTAPLTRVNDRLAKLTAPARAFQTSLRKFGEESGLTKLGEQAVRVRERIGGVVEQTRKLGKELLIGGSIGGFAIGEMLSRSVDRGAGLAHQSKQLGISVDNLKRYQFIGGQVGLQQDALNEGLATFNQSLGQARQRKGKLFEGLVTSPHTLRELLATKDTGAAFDVALKKFSQIRSAQERAYFGSVLFGRGVGASMAELKMSSKDLDDLNREYHELYGSQDAFAEGAEQTEKAFGRAKAAWEGASDSLMAQLFPALARGTNALTRFLVGHRGEFERWGRELAPKVERFAESLPARLERIGNFFGKLYRAARPFADLVGGMPNLALLIGGVALTAPLLNSVLQLTLALGGLGAKALWAGGLVKYALRGGAAAAGGAGLGGAAGAAGAGAAEGVGGVVAGGAAGGAGAAVGIGALLPIAIVSGYLYTLYDAIKSAPSAPEWKAPKTGKEAASLREFFRSKPTFQTPGFGLRESDVSPVASHFSPAALRARVMPLDELGSLGRRALSVDISDHSIERLADEIRKPGGAPIAPVKSHVTIELKNAPRGTRVTTHGNPELSLLTGFTMAEAQ
jgi:hypothetical protein